MADRMGIGTGIELEATDREVNNMVMIHYIFLTLAK